MASAKTIPLTASPVGPLSTQSRKRASPNDEPRPSASGGNEGNNKKDRGKEPQNVPPFQNINYPEVQSKPVTVVELDDDDDDDDDDDMVVDMDDIRAQQEQLDRGAKALLARRFAPGKIPDEVRKLNRELSPLVRQWWRDGAAPKSHEQIFKKFDNKVDKICHALANKEFEEALQEELAQQVKAKRIAVDDELAKEQFKNDFWEYGSRPGEPKKWSFFYFEMRAKDGEPQPWMHKWKSYAEYFRFPRSQIQGHIMGLGLGAKNIAKLKEEINSLQVEDITNNVEKEKDGTKKSHEGLSKELSRIKKNVIEGALVFTNMLENYQLEPKLLIPDQYKVLFAEMVNESEETKKTHKEFLSRLMNPLEEQNEIWQDAHGEMQQFFKQAIDPQGNLSKMNEILESIKKKNGELASVNQQLGIIPHHHQLPYPDMRAICHFKKSSSHNGEVEKRMQKIKALMTVWWDDHDLANVFPSQVGDVRLGDEQLLEQQRKLLQITQREGIPSSPHSSPNNLESVLPSISRSPKLSAPPSSSPSSFPYSSNQTNATPHESARGLFVNEDPSASADLESIFKTFDLEDDTIQMMLYDDGRTEYGKLEATRPCRTGNVRLSRFIVNAGTEKVPFYKIIKGSDLGPGGAEAFHEDKWQNLYTRFDLAIRRQAMKQVGGCTIKAIGPCIEMPRETPTRPTKSGKAYRLDLYVKVEYHKDETKNPHAKSHPTVEWLTRTELGQLMGKKYADTQEKIMMARYKKRQIYFDECKRRQINPETKQPLSTIDFEEYPWLFLDDAVLPNETAAKQPDANGDYNMDEVEVDGATEDEEL